jgi:capsule polysaccharide export protein KpsC/LpsZ
MPANNAPSMPLTSYSDKELVRIVDNTPNATSLERELANRIDAALQVTEILNKLKENPYV